MITAARKDLIAYTYYSFAHIYEFDYEIEDLQYYSEIRNSKGELVSTFVITKGIDQIILEQSEEVMRNYQAGTYDYDVKQVSASGHSTMRIYGNFVVKTGRTQIP